jgi:hypothetical protein
MMVMAVGVRSMAVAGRRVIMSFVIVTMAVIMLGGMVVVVMLAAHGRDFPAPAPSARQKGRFRLTPGPA